MKKILTATYLLIALFIASCSTSNPPQNIDTPPSQPQGLVITAGHRKLSLSWNANSETDLSGYVVYWGTSGSNLSNKQTIAATATTYEITGLSNSTAYFVAMTAKDVAGKESAKTPASSATPTAAPDTTEPTIVSMTPSDGSNGINPFDSISITFSEAMNRASVQVAFNTNPADIKTSGSFNWNSDGRTVTFHPGRAWNYGEVVGFWIDNTVATDLSGNYLSGSNGNVFQVIREVTSMLYSQSSLDGSITSNGNVYPDDAVSYIGDFSENGYERAFLSFDLSSLPENITEIVSAKLTVHQESVTGNDIYADPGLGIMLVESVIYGDALDSSDFATPTLTYEETCSIHASVIEPLCTPGTYSLSYNLSNNAALEDKYNSVYGMVTRDWENRTDRSHRSQFRIKFENDFTGDSLADYVSINVSAASDLRPRLEITYLAP